MPDVDTYFIDFDETLFDHNAFIDWIDSALVGHGLIKNIGEFAGTVDEHHTKINDVLRLYRHREHYQSRTNVSWSYASGLLHAELTKQPMDFCYDDSHGFLEWLVAKKLDARILSFGDGDYQRFKIMTCKMVRDINIPIHITDQPKSDFFTHYYSRNKTAVLVDDKFPLHLPNHVEHILIDRKNQYQTNEVTTITSLKELIGN